MSTIIPAAEWGRKLAPGRELHPMPGPALYVIVHHTAGTDRRSLVDECRAIDEDARNDTPAKACIDYSFVVNGAGERAEGRGWGIIGAHTGAEVPIGWPAAGESFNVVGLAIVAVGNYEDDEPTDALLDAIVQTIAEGIVAGYIVADVRVLGHRDASPTACPGANLYPYVPGIEVEAKIKARDHDGDDEMPSLPELEQLIRRVITEELHERGMIEHREPDDPRPLTFQQAITAAAGKAVRDNTEGIKRKLDHLSEDLDRLATSVSVIAGTQRFAAGDPFDAITRPVDRLDNIEPLTVEGDPLVGRPELPESPGDLARRIAAERMARTEDREPLPHVDRDPDAPDIDDEG